MRIADLVVGEVYRYKDRAGGTAWGVCILLDVEPWTRGGPLYRPHDPATDGSYGRDRQVPIADLMPIVTLADGTRHVMDFGWQLNVGCDSGGWSTRGRVEPRQLQVIAVPRLLSVRAIACPAPASWANLARHESVI